MSARAAAPDAADAPAARVYCTYFDSHYLARGLAMLRSLLRWDPGARPQVLCLDAPCARVVAEILGTAVEVITLDSLLARDRELASRRDGRTTWAFYATLKPAFVREVLARAHARVTFIDADTWFFSDPAPLFAEIGAASIALSPHRLHAGTQHLAHYGRYNAGCIAWADDATARRCLADWRAACLEWCDEVPSDGRFMNQGYLDAWPERYPGVHVIAHPGVNLGPWNVDGHALARAGEGVSVDGAALIFFHFSGVVHDRENRWYSLYPQQRRQLDLVLEAIYAPYLEAVERERLRLQRYGISGTGSVRRLAIGPDALRLKA